MAVHPPSIPPALRSPRGVGSGQGIPRHTGGPVDRCSLPGLAGFTGSRRAGPSLHRLPARLSPKRGNLGREFDPAIADCGYRAPLPPRLARPQGFGWSWRRERDSNPRYAFWTYTRFPVVPLRPLGHLSGSAGGGGGIRTHVGARTPNSISSRARYDHFGTPPQILVAPVRGRGPGVWAGLGTL